MNDWAVVPVKSIANGKSRLAPILSRPRRQRLNRELLVHTLALASTVVGKHWVIVVSHCAETRKIAKTLGVRFLREPRGLGLNRALGLARDYAVSHGANGVLVLPSDLPLVSVSDLRRVRQVGRHRKSIVICRDRHRYGTNALYLSHPSNFEFQFGENSAASHSEEAGRRGLSALSMDAPRLGFDLDTPKDYRDYNEMRLSARANITHDIVKLRY
jgi:2-phospho-L-lactate guanylyltransferase